MLRVKKHNIFLKIISLLIMVCFSANMILPPEALAQGVFSLPTPGAMVNLSSGFVPVMLRGIKVYPENPFKFDFIVDSGNTGLQADALKDESQKLAKYFLAALTTPEEDLWVNLSPYEDDRIIPDALGQMDMGRDLLAQDYILKQVTASLIYPDSETGRDFWQKVYKKAYEEYGTTSIPVNTFNKVWIVPEKAVIYEDNEKAFVAESHLKVMLEQDYLSLENNSSNKKIGTDTETQENVEKTSEISSQIVREVVLPLLEKEVNEGKNFANLRQIYHAMILATWYKQALKTSILNKVYSDKSKVSGVNVDDPQATEKIYDQYLDAFQKGVCNLVRVEQDPATQKPIARKYFSGGFEGNKISSSITKNPLSSLKTAITTFVVGAMFLTSIALTNPVQALEVSAPVVPATSPDTTISDMSYENYADLAVYGSIDVLMSLSDSDFTSQPWSEEIVKRATDNLIRTDPSVVLDNLHPLQSYPWSAKLIRRSAVEILMSSYPTSHSDYYILMDRLLTISRDQDLSGELRSAALSTYKEYFPIALSDMMQFESEVNTPQVMEIVYKAINATIQPEITNKLRQEIGEKFSKLPQGFLFYLSIPEVVAPLLEAHKELKANNIDIDLDFFVGAAFAEGYIVYGRHILDGMGWEKFSVNGPIGMDRFGAVQQELKEKGWLPKDYEGFVPNGRIFINKNKEEYPDGDFKSPKDALIAHAALLLQDRTAFIRVYQRAAQKAVERGQSFPELTEDMINVGTYLFYSMGQGRGAQVLQENNFELIKVQGGDANARWPAATTEFLKRLEIFKSQVSQQNDPDNVTPVSNETGQNTLPQQGSMQEDVIQGFAQGVTYYPFSLGGVDAFLLALKDSIADKTDLQVVLRTSEGKNETVTLTPAMASSVLKANRENNLTNDKLAKTIAGVSRESFPEPMIETDDKVQALGSLVGSQAEIDGVQPLSKTPFHGNTFQRTRQGLADYAFSTNEGVVELPRKLDNGIQVLTGPAVALDYIANYNQGAVIVDYEPAVEGWVATRNVLLKMAGSRQEFFNLLTGVDCSKLDLNKIFVKENVEDQNIVGRFNLGLRNKALPGDTILARAIYAQYGKEQSIAKIQEHLNGLWEKLVQQEPALSNNVYAKAFWGEFATAQRAVEIINSMFSDIGKDKSWLSSEVLFNNVKNLADQGKIVGVTADWTSADLSSKVQAALDRFGPGTKVSFAYLTNLREWNRYRLAEIDKTILENLEGLPLTENFQVRDRALNSNALPSIDEVYSNSIEPKSVSSPAIDPVGGIDLNAKNLELKTTGQAIEFSLPPEWQNVDLNSIQGFMPVIINIIPIMNLQNLMSSVPGSSAAVSS